MNFCSSSLVSFSITSPLSRPNTPRTVLTTLEPNALRALARDFSSAGFLIPSFSAMDSLKDSSSPAMHTNSSSSKESWSSSKSISNASITGIPLRIASTSSRARIPSLIASSAYSSISLSAFSASSSTSSEIEILPEAMSSTSLSVIKPAPIAVFTISLISSSLAISTGSTTSKEAAASTTESNSNS